MRNENSEDVARRTTERKICAIQKGKGATDIFPQEMMAPIPSECAVSLLATPFDPLGCGIHHHL